MQRIETSILSSLIYNEDYLRKVFPFLKQEYFTDPVDNKLFTTISKFIEKYNNNPTKEAIEIALQNDHTVREDVYENCMEQLNELEPSITTMEWMVEESESFCKRQSIFNAVSRSIQIIDGKDKELSSDAIPSLLQDALSVAFNTDIGHDYLNDVEKRYEFYHAVDERIPFKLDMLNRITGGGVANKSLSCFLCPTGGGKTVLMCDNAAFNLEMGLNVLYFTAEMAEERISERIDANLLDVSIKDLKTLDKDTFLGRMGKIKSKTRGNLIVKEFPTSSAHVGHLKAVINELRIKKNFKPDIIYLDYLNIFVSQRFKANVNANSYTIVKSIAEEIRGLAMELNIPVITATQVNRNGFDNTDIDITDTSESIGLPATLDFYAAIIPTEELDQMGKTMFKQLKNRWGDINTFKRFLVGKDFGKMRFFDLDDAMSGIVKQAVDKNNEPAQQKSKFEGKDFNSINFG